MSTPNSRRFSSPMTSNSPNNVNSRLSVGSSHSSLPSPGVSYSDRLIPSRRSSNLEEAFDIMDATNSVNAVTSFSASNLAGMLLTSDRSPPHCEYFVVYMLMQMDRTVISITCLMTLEARLDM